MTESKAERHRGKSTNPTTVVGAYSLEISRLLSATGNDGKWRWPSKVYRDDPGAFVREVLGVELWPRMEEMLCAVRDNPRVSVSASRKVSKTYTDICIALWWFSCWFDAKVILTAPTDRQVNRELWMELRKLHYRSQHEIDPEDPALTASPERMPRPMTRSLDGEPLQLARSGLLAGFRSIYGFTAREGVAAAGVSGAHQLWIIDEASGISQPIMDAILGNMAGGGRMLLSGNPTSTDGEFYDSHHSKKKTPENPRGYYAMTISAEESPNVVAGRTIFPGLAEPDWLEDRRREWGKDSAQYKIHCQGQFCEVEEGKIISIKDIAEAEKRWNYDGEDFVAGEGVLHVGIDPAFSMSGDEAVFVPRRGKRIFEIRPERGLRDEGGHLAVLLDVVGQYREPGELVVVNVDALGDVGSKVYYCLRNYAEQHPGVFIVCGVRGSDNAVRQAEAYVRVRDELWAVGALWIREGGTLPEDPRTAKDLHAPSWFYDLKKRAIATKKDDLRKILGRSPDRGDGVCLACWDNSGLVAQEQEQSRARQEATTTRPTLLDEPATNGMDPFAALDQWGRG